MSEPTAERWLPVVNHPGYEVSDHGRVRSVDRVVTCVDGRRIPYRGQILKPRLGDGYLGVCLRRRESRMVHHLVLEAFIGPRPAGMVSCHWDDEGTNNHLSNLRWDTINGNQRDRVRNGRHDHANKTHCPRNHPLTGRNLIPAQLRKGRRGCLACNRAGNLRNWRRKQGAAVPELGPLADAYYLKIVSDVDAIAPRWGVHRPRRRATGKSGDQTDAA